MFNNENVKVMISKNEWCDLPGFKLLFFYQDNQTKEIFYPKFIEFTRHPEATAIPRSSVLDISTNAAQKMMNDLWDAGLRPPYMQHTTETVVALKEHISDFRKIISKLLKLEEKK